MIKNIFLLSLLIGSNILLAGVTDDAIKEEAKKKVFETLVDLTFAHKRDITFWSYDVFREVLGMAKRSEDDLIKQIVLNKPPRFKNFMVRFKGGKKGSEIILIEGNTIDRAAYVFWTNEDAELIKCLYKVYDEDGRPVPDQVARERFADEVSF